MSMSREEDLLNAQIREVKAREEFGRNSRASLRR